MTSENVKWMILKFQMFPGQTLPSYQLSFIIQTSGRIGNFLIFLLVIIHIKEDSSISFVPIWHNGLHFVYYNPSRWHCIVPAILEQLIQYVHRLV